MRFPTSWHRAVLLCFALFAACEQQPDAFGPDFGVLSISLTPSIDTVLVGDSVQLSATVVMNNNQPPRGLNWTSAMSALASVSQTGVVRGLHAGQGFIIASSGNKKDSATVTVLSPLPPPPVPVALVVVSPASTTVRVGATTQLTATPEDGNGNPLTGRTVTWASNNAGVATVNASGLVTPMGVGAATITAASEGQSGTAAVTVATVPVASVTLTPATASVLLGATVQLSATTKDSAGNVLTGRTITWASSNTAAATVSSIGLVSGVAAGTATITVTSEGKSATASVTVTVAIVPVASVTVTPATASIFVGATQQLTATTKDSAGNVLTGRTITWASSNAAVAAVSATGLASGVTAGSATITATSEGKSATASVTVANVPVASVTVSPATAGLLVGATTQLSATTKDSAGNALTGRTITWASSNTTTATVSATGLVTAKAAGSTTITATSEGKSGTSTVTVTLAPVASVSVSPTSASLTIGQTVQLTATPKDANGTALTGRIVTWGSSNSTVASVSASGLVTGLTAGSVIVTATSEGKSGTVAVAVSTTSTGCVPTGSGVCRYVDGAAGNDANPGTSTQPFRTLSKAAGVVNPGDVVIVRSGVYTGGSGAILDIVRGGTATNLVVFKAEQQWGAVLDGQSNTSSTGVRFSTNYARAEGFEIKGVNHYGIDMGVGLTGLEAAKNNIHDVGRMCTDAVIGLAGFAVDNNDVIIEQNLVHDIGRYGPGENGCNPLKPYWQNQDHGIYLSSGTNVTIRSNIFYNMVHGWPIHRFNVSALSVDRAYIVNNTFAFPNPNRDGQIIVSSPLTNSVIANNIFYKPLTAGIWFDAGGTTSNVLVANNITSNGPVNVGTSSGVTYSNNYNNTDPLLVNPTGLDFHLRAGSPAILAGLSLTYVPTDFDGVSRPQGTALDIGAYQFK